MKKRVVVFHAVRKIMILREKLNSPKKKGSWRICFSASCKELLVENSSHDPLCSDKSEHLPLHKVDDSLRDRRSTRRGETERGSMQRVRPASPDEISFRQSRNGCFGESWWDTTPTLIRQESIVADLAEVANGLAHLA